MNEKKADKIAVLSEDYDLSQDSDLELAAILKKLSGEYEMCRYCLSTATLDVWHGIVRVAKEIVKRETCTNSRDLIELAALVSVELDYPEKWDVAAYPTVWEALWESYSWLKTKVEKLEKYRIYKRYIRFKNFALRTAISMAARRAILKIMNREWREEEEIGAEEREARIIEEEKRG